MRIFVFLVVLLLSPGLSAQSESAAKEAVREEIKQFFTLLAAKDTAALRQAFNNQPYLSSFYRSKGESKKKLSDLNSFLTGLAGLEEARLEERILSVEVRLDGPMAMAWVPYQFYFNDKLSHCGVNVFIMLNKNGRWLIDSITDTRQREECEP